MWRSEGPGARDAAMALSWMATTVYKPSIRTLYTSTGGRFRSRQSLADSNPGGGDIAWLMTYDLSHSLEPKRPLLAARARCRQYHLCTSLTRGGVWRVGGLGVARFDNKACVTTREASWGTRVARGATVGDYSAV